VAIPVSPDPRVYESPAIPAKRSFWVNIALILAFIFIVYSLWNNGVTSFVTSVLNIQSTGQTPQPSLDAGGFQDFYHVQPPYRGAANPKVTLISNPGAVDPTWAQLVAFVTSDPTDLRIYDENTYVCADFAQQVQQDTEASGLKCAWVAINFADGGEAMRSTLSTRPIKVWSS